MPPTSASITVGVKLDITGCVSVGIVADPPNETDTPLIVIWPFAKAEFGITLFWNVKLSPASPIAKLVPDCGAIVSTSILLII